MYSYGAVGTADFVIIEGTEVRAESGLRIAFEVMLEKECQMCSDNWGFWAVLVLDRLFDRIEPLWPRIEEAHHVGQSVQSEP